MRKEQSNIEDPHHIIMDVRRKGKAPRKMKRKKSRLTETDIDLFVEDEKEQ